MINTNSHPLYALRYMDNEKGREVVRLTLINAMPNDVPAMTMTGQQIGNAVTYLSCDKVGHVEVAKKWRSTVDADGRLTIGDSWAYDVTDLEREMRATRIGGGNYPIVIKVPA